MYILRKYINGVLIIANIICGTYLIKLVFNDEYDVRDYIGGKFSALYESRSGIAGAPIVDQEAFLQVRDRIRARIVEIYRLRFIEMLRAPDAIMEMHIKDIKYRIYRDYKDLLNELGLPIEETKELVEWLARRKIDATYIIDAPPTVFESGIPHTLVFGEAEVDELIASEFSDDIVKRIWEYDAESRVGKERAELLGLLSSIGFLIDRNIVRKLDEAIRMNPLGDAMSRAEDASSLEEYYNYRHGRINQLVETVSNELGQRAGRLIHAYLEDKEEAEYGENVLALICSDGERH